MEEVDDNELQKLNEIFVKAAKDPEFRNTLLKDPNVVLEKYQLSKETKHTILEAIR
jgi:hypothetical protein